LTKSVTRRGQGAALRRWRCAARHRGCRHWYNRASWSGWCWRLGTLWPWSRPRCARWPGGAHRACTEPRLRPPGYRPCRAAMSCLRTSRCQSG